MPKFSHHDLELLNPSFDSPLVDVMTELEHLRRLRIGGDTPAAIFFQLKDTFHMLESLGSARIEGNHTTLADYVESRIEGSITFSDHMREIANIEKAMAYIEDALKPGDPLTEHLIKELHALAVDGLKREGDNTPGAYRTGMVKIQQSEHLPPDAIHVPTYMDELIAFINNGDLPKYDLMKVALAHHRFGWIHPFKNGNGRVVRLLTFAMLIKYGFNVSTGVRLLNPTAVFCNDRDRYYNMLAVADSGTREGLANWCEYVLGGILEELKKIDKLTNYSYLKAHVLVPAIRFARDRELITSTEFRILNHAIEKTVIKAGDLAEIEPSLSPSQRTYQIRKLLDQRMLQPTQPNARQYAPGFANTYLMRGVIRALTDEGFIPDRLASP